MILLKSDSSKDYNSIVYCKFMIILYPLIYFSHLYIKFDIPSFPRVSSQFPFRFVGGLPGVMVPVVFIVHRPLCGAFRLVVCDCLDDNGCKSTFAPQVSCWRLFEDYLHKVYMINRFSEIT